VNGWSITGIGYLGTWNSTDQVAQRAIVSGLVGRFSAIDPTDGGDTSPLQRHLRLAARVRQQRAHEDHGVWPRVRSGPLFELHVAEQDEAAVTSSRAQHLARVIRERRAVERDEHQTGFGARHHEIRRVYDKETRSGSRRTLVLA